MRIFGKKIEDFIMERIQAALSQEANRLLQEAYTMCPLLSHEDETAMDENIIVEGSVSYPIDDPSRLLES